MKTGACDGKLESKVIKLENRYVINKLLENIRDLTQDKKGTHVFV